MLKLMCIVECVFTNRIERGVLNSNADCMTLDEAKLPSWG